jgi:hypothetical protein
VDHLKVFTGYVLASAVLKLRKARNAARECVSANSS